MREQQLLEDQRDAISRLLVESHRAIEKVVTREDRIGQLEECHGPIAGAEQTSARLAQAAIDTAARLQQIQQITDRFRDDLTRLETDVRALADSPRRPAARDRLEGHASEADVHTPRAVGMRRSGHRWAIAAGLLLVGLTVTRSLSHTTGISDDARAENRHPLLTASALVLRPIPLMSSGPAMTTAAVTTLMPPPMNAGVVRGTTARSEFRGSLAIRSNPVGAAVFVNRRYVGDTPIQLPRWRAGTHVVWVDGQDTSVGPGRYWFRRIRSRESTQRWPPSVSKAIDWG